MVSDGGMVSGDLAVSLTASATDLLGVAEQEFADAEVTLGTITNRAKELGAPAGMPYEEAGTLLLMLASYRYRAHAQQNHSGGS
jgi:hypothetical protein